MTDNSGSNFALGFLVGAVIGGVAALLLAPKSGSETRDMLQHKAEAARERARDVADAARVGVEEAAERAKASAAEAAKRAQAKIEAFKSA